MNKATVTAILAMICCANSTVGEEKHPDFTCDYLGQKTPDEIPVKFAPGVVSTNGLEHSSPVFSFDGTEMFWISIALPVDSNPKKLWFTKSEKGVWSGKKVVSFSCESGDDAPVFSPDGNRLYFNSSRPHPNGGDGSVWYVERTANGWSEPVYDPQLNADGNRGGLTFARNGNVYFTGANSGTANGFGICFSKFTKQGYSKPEPLGTHINKPGYLCWTPFIAPDESYLIYSTSLGELNQASDYGNLTISFHQPDGGWSDPVDLGNEINTPAQERFPYVTPDGKYLFFTRWTSDGDQDVFWVKNTIVSKLQGQFNGTREK